MTYMRPEDQGLYSIEFSSLLSVQREQAHQIFVKLQSCTFGPQNCVDNSSQTTRFTLMNVLQLEESN